jgi:HEAT repeat protein
VALKAERLQTTITYRSLGKWPRPIADVQLPKYALDMTSPADDIRSVPELLHAALQADEVTAWDAVAALHWRGSSEVLDGALALLCSSNPTERGRAADILGQIGIPERTFPDQCFFAVRRLLDDENQRVVFDAIFALQHIDPSRAASYIIPFADHEWHEIRYAVAFALGAVDSGEAQSTLLSLMTDRDPEVRNWATFGLGQQSDADSDAIRQALASRLSDDDPDVRYEAVIGLGRRRDRRALGFLKTMLHSDPDDVFAREAAAKLLGFDESGERGTDELLGSLQRLQRWGGDGAADRV